MNWKFTRKEFKAMKRAYKLGMISLSDWNRYYMTIVRRKYPKWTF